MTPDLTNAVWRKSTRSDNNGGACVEVADNLPAVVAVRDSKDRQGPVLSFTTRQWIGFVQGVKDGTLDA
ncbi:DUF397 domain-containing protein [Micromonospora sp. NPDC002389]|uniref:DUF397 domain-containing protein n=1 Tax=Micromonospora sp. NPDC002389 TaxID=3154272 RepID=UPI00331A010B